MYLLGFATKKLGNYERGSWLSAEKINKTLSSRLKLSEIWDKQVEKQGLKSWKGNITIIFCNVNQICRSRRYWLISWVASSVLGFLFVHVKLLSIMMVICCNWFWKYLTISEIVWTSVIVEKTWVKINSSRQWMLWMR